MEYSLSAYHEDLYLELGKHSSTRQFLRPEDGAHNPVEQNYLHLINYN